MEKMNNPLETLGSLCGDRYMYTLPPTINHEQAARELLEQLRVEKLGVIKEYEHPYLCLKHFKKILKLLNIKYQENGDYQ